MRSVTSTPSICAIKPVRIIHHVKTYIRCKCRKCSTICCVNSRTTVSIINNNNISHLLHSVHGHLYDIKLAALSVMSMSHAAIVHRILDGAACVCHIITARTIINKYAICRINITTMTLAQSRSPAPLDLSRCN